MAYLAPNGLPLIEEDEATGEVAQIYEEFKREMGVPVIPNAMKALAVSPAALAIYWTMLKAFYQYSTLPQSLTAMILFTIAESSNCRYCSASHELTCRTLGVDEATLQALVEDLGNVSPQRVQVIIEFALKVCHNAQGLVAADFERVREQGVTNAEIMEIIQIAALGKHNDTMADAMQIEVDSMVLEALGR